ncbi:MAG: [FeFe] hydrogenase, group A [Planctomycetota bacterium]|nr:[FeFe] hydrogenase, group A [Planctomycetota bacterium]
MDNNGKGMVVIDGTPVEIEGEKNLLEVIRKAGIELPTFCYLSELSIHGACRLCIVEDSRGGLFASCSEPPRDGMEIRTNTEQLRKYRRNILELLLANHCRDCTVCGFNGRCKLQSLVVGFNLTRVRFPNAASEPVVDDSSLCIVKDQSKCILCGDCVRMCDEIQGVGAIDFARRGSKMTISTAFDIPLAQSDCVGCGQCAAVCPTGAIVVRNDTERLWTDLGDPGNLMTAQVAPAVRVALGREFGLEEGENAIGKIMAALRRLGFAEVYDTSTGADLTILEEARELLDRLNDGKRHDLPLFTSCCPAWVRFCETRHPELVGELSTSFSPMHMLASVLKEQYKDVYRKVIHAAIMPCTAKKYERARPEFARNGGQLVDHVITTQGLIRMIRESGLVFSELEPEATDSPLGDMSGAGVIFGVSGGVTEAVLRRISTDRSPAALRKIAFTGVRGMSGLKTASARVGEREARIAVVSGLANADRLIRRLKAGEEHFDFVEVMACPGGCVSGAGQPSVPLARRELRGKGLYSADKLCHVRRAEDNPLMISLYRGLLKGRTHELLHVNREASGHVSHGASGGR